jgi:hypothetical protein
LRKSFEAVTTWFEICETSCVISATVTDRQFNAEEFIKLDMQETVFAEMTVDRTVQLMLDNVIILKSDSENYKSKRYCKGD